MKKYIILSAAALTLAFTSCEEYLDVNTNPNSPSEENLTANELFPSVEMQLAATYGGDLRSVAGYHAQHYSQSFGTSNYLDYSRFQMSATRCAQFYTLYTQRCLSNIKTILEKSEATEDWGSYLAATTLRAFIYQNMVDCWGEIPYSEALDANNTSPKYDDGADIYAGIIAELDAALEKTSASDAVCTNFLFPSEKADSWIKFANALKLRILMRESNVKDVQSQLKALVEENNFPTSDVQFEGCFGTEQYTYSPFYDNDFAAGRQVNIVANLAIVGTMQQKDSEGNITFIDGRLEKYFEKNSNNEFTGSISGTNFSTSNNYKSSYWCRPVASETMPVIILSVAETEFFLAEYYARYGSATDAASHYEAAINASFDAVGASGADEVIAKYPFDVNNYAKILGIAKWVDLSGYNSFEAWCEMRRLGYPTFGTVKGSDMYNEQTDASYKPELYVAGTLYTPLQVYGQVGENQLLARYPYPESSTSRNSNSPEFPGYTTPVFWVAK